MQHESKSFSNISATTDPFVLNLGGAYAVSVKATFGGGSVKFQQLGPDNTTYLDLKAAFDNAGTEQDDVVGTFSADGMKTFVIPPGQYRFTITTATAVYAAAVRCPLS